MRATPEERARFADRQRRHEEAYERKVASRPDDSALSLYKLKQLSRVAIEDGKRLEWATEVTPERVLAALAAAEWDEHPENRLYDCITCKDGSITPRGSICLACGEENPRY